jgi:hypothetical protein
MFTIMLKRSSKFSAGCKYSPDFFLRGLQVQPAPGNKKASVTHPGSWLR